VRHELQSIRKLFAKLIRAKRTAFPREGVHLVAPDKQGVYLIYSPRGQVLHVGRTVSGQKGLQQRLKNHLQGKSSFTAADFKRDGSQLRSSHSYAFVRVRNDRHRALLEAFAVGNLCPKHLGVGKSRNGK